MMKIPDLNKIDIKDLDINKIKKAILENKEATLKIGLGAVAFFMIVSMLGGSQKEIRTFKNQIDVMQSKSPLIEQYNKSQTNIQGFLKKIPASLTEAQIIGLVTDLADKNQVKILTFMQNAVRPDGKKSYQETAIQFSLRAKNYKSLVQLISDIEHSQSILHVKSCVVDNEGDKQGSSSQEDVENSALNFRLEVASLEVKK
jgi:hypothetical protein